MGEPERRRRRLRPSAGSAAPAPPPPADQAAGAPADPPVTARPADRRAVPDAAAAGAAEGGSAVTGAIADPGSEVAPPVPAAPISPAPAPISPAPTERVVRPPRNGGRRPAPGADDREAERGLRGLVGSGSSQVSVGAALRARDAARPTDEDLADADRNLTIVRRNWVPREDLPRNR
ncbi:hypothetical protein [Actinoplanes sp. URMC 104]|uniref:hypothetical protein n=1 Tax=Actinoplanes sp. URMC 104 TaxID=3423409 RepID=UPI003F1D13F1